MKLYTCSCCGFKTLSEGEGSFEICNVCSWEEDSVMEDKPDSWGGANNVCLRQAQRNFISFGASEKRFQGRVVNGSFEKDSLWKPVWEKEATLNEDEFIDIKIEGIILKKGYQKSMDMNEFLDKFQDFLESNDWGFGGDTTQIRNQKYKE